MRRAAIIVVALLAFAATNGRASAGIDQVFTKPEGKPSWGEIFKWALGSGGFDKSYALVIGISEYPGDFESLRSTKNDPIRMKNFLLEEAGFDHVHVLTDEKAQIGKIKQLMEGKFRRLVERDDRFLFYWSGHGTQVKDALGRTVGYLPLGDSKRDETWTMISMDDVSNWDRWIKAEHVLFLLDACFSGLAGSEAKDTLQDFAIQQLSKPAHHLISAGTGDQQTIAGERWNGSIFTDSIIQAARGEADAQSAFPRDGVVNLAELLAFVRQRIDHERREAKWDKAITPQWNHLRSNEGEFFFVTKARKVKVAKRLGTPTGALNSGMPIVEPLRSSAAAAPSCDRSADRLYWESIKDETNPAYFKAYLAKVANGKLCGLFEDIARIKVKGDERETIAAVVPPPGPQSPPTNEIEVTDRQMVAAKTSNVRAAPRVDSTKIGRLPVGATINVSGQTTVSGSIWYRVALASGATGFVFGPLLRELPSQPVESAVGTKADEPPPKPAGDETLSTNVPSSKIQDDRERMVPDTRAKTLEELLQQAVAKVQQGNYAGASNDYEAAIELYPDDDSVKKMAVLSFLTYAETLETRGDRERATLILMRAQQLDPTNAEIRKRILRLQSSRSSR